MLPAPFPARLFTVLSILFMLFGRSDAAGPAWDHLVPASTVNFVVRTGSGVLYAAGGYDVRRSIDDGATWGDFSTGLLGDTILAMTYSPHRNHIYLGMPPALFSASDSVTSWRWITTTLGAEISDVQCSPVEPYSVYAGTRMGIWHTEDEIRWNAFTLPYPVYDDSITCLGVNSDGWIYFCSRYFYYWNNYWQAGGEIRFSTDFGENWEITSSGHQLAYSIGVRYSCMAFDTSSYITTENLGIFRHHEGDSVSMLRSYSQVNQGLEFSSVTSSIVADSNGTMYAGTIGGGVYRRKWADDPQWENISGDLPTRNVSNVYLDNLNRLYVCTTDSGLYRSRDPIINAVASTGASAPSGFELLPAYPNPFNGEVTISVRLEKTAAIRLRVFDLAGRQIAVLADGVEQPGVRTFRWRPGERSTGSYFCLLEAGGRSSIQKISYVK